MTERRLESMFHFKRGGDRGRKEEVGKVRGGCFECILVERFLERC